MSLKISNLQQNNELVELSVDEQMKLVGGVSGFKQTPENLYSIDLGKYARGEASIGSSGDFVTFSYEANGRVVDSFKISGGTVEQASQNGRTNELFAFNPNGPIEQSLLNQS
jgi:hypothetical protein